MIPTLSTTLSEDYQKIWEEHMNRNRPLRLLITLALIFCFACATKTNDPLKNTKKLAKEGHSNLYHNGAFRVPNTSIYLIEPGPSAIDFIKELAGLRAKQALFTSLKKASESVVIVTKGTELTFKLAKAERKAGNDVADFIRSQSRPGAVLIMDRSMATGKEILGDSFSLSKEMFKEVVTMEEKKLWSVEKGDKLSESIDKGGTGKGKELISDSLHNSKSFYNDRQDGAKGSWNYAWKNFVYGYAALPDNLSKNLEAAGENLTDANIVDIISEKNDSRESMSDQSVQLMGSAVGNYAGDVKETFSKAGKEWDQCYTTGIPLATLKSMRWILKGLLWDATIEPVSKMTIGGLGYMAVNFVAFPVMVIGEEGKAFTRIAVDVSWNASKSAYQLTAPSAIASLASIYGLLEYGSGPLVAGPMAAGGSLAGASQVGASKVGGVVVKGTGRLAGKAERYIGIPLAAAGVAVTGGTVGVAVMGAGAVGSGTVYLSGETTAGGSKLFGNIIAGTTAVTGTAASAAGGTGYGVYQLSRAVAVPAGYEVGAGVVMSYETLSHISAHTILAASDCAYMVLSLEGPRWVAYAVKDTLGMGEDLTPGTVLNLDEMRKAGEEIYNIPLSDEEMKNVVSETSRSLPHFKDESAPNN
jgi:hypothetical protein